MIRYDKLQLEDDNRFTVFKDCLCRLRNGCSSCCGTGLIPEVFDLTIVLHNLAVAGALCEAHWQRWYTSKLLCRHWEPGCERTWSRQ
jgi:hypothetical protein